MNTRNKLIAAVAAALVGTTPMLLAQETKSETAGSAAPAKPYRPGGAEGPGHGMGGMMGGPAYGHSYGMGHGRMGEHGYGMGPGMMGGYGHGWGMDPGMMGGRGCGPGMMGPGMMSPGMMGPGMMGPGMMGPGMMMGPAGMSRMRAIWSLDLTEEQAGRIDNIHEDLHRTHHGLMSQMWDAQERLRDLYNADARDPAAIGKAYAQVSDVQRQMLESQVRAERQMEDVLSPEQREQLHREVRRSQRYRRYGG